MLSWDEENIDLLKLLNKLIAQLLCGIRGSSEKIDIFAEKQKGICPKYKAVKKWVPHIIT